jgi:hypothetical protein
VSGASGRVMPGPGVKSDKLPPFQFAQDSCFGHSFENDRENTFRLRDCPVDLPFAAWRIHCFGRDYVDDSIRLSNQRSKARLPILSGRNIVPVKKWRKSRKIA